MLSHAAIYPLDPSQSSSLKDLEAELLKTGWDYQYSPATKKEALLAHQGKVSGVVLEGVDLESVDSVLDYRSKLILGSKKLSDNADVPYVYIGKTLFERFDLKLEDSFAVVIPYQDVRSGMGFSRKVYTFKVGGVLDLGSYSANKRFIVMEKAHVNKLALKPEGFFSEIKVKIQNPDQINDFRQRFLSANSDKYWMNTWKSKSRGFLEAVEIERVVIFFLVFILVVVAAFNVSTNLYLNLSKRLKDFSVLRSIGLQKSDIMKILFLNGLFLGGAGLFFGLGLAVFAVELLNYILSSGAFVPPDVYKLTSVSLALSWIHVLVVGLSTLVMCVLAALAPALSSKKLSIVGGLRYE